MTMYLVVAEHVMKNAVMFLAASSMTEARKELPRYSDSTGYMTLWKPRWATKEDTKTFAKEFKQANIQPAYEFKNEK